MKLNSNFLWNAFAASALTAPFFVTGCSTGPGNTTPGIIMTYPRAEKENQQDNYHGTIVADPYRWLEDDNSPRTHEWVEAENKVTFDFLDKIPEREAIKHRLTE